MIRSYEEISSTGISEELYHHIVMHVFCILSFYNRGKPECKTSANGLKCATCPLSNNMLRRAPISFELEGNPGCKTNLKHIINIIAATNPELIFEEIL